MGFLTYVENVESILLRYLTWLGRLSNFCAIRRVCSEISPPSFAACLTSAEAFSISPTSGNSDLAAASIKFLAASENSAGLEDFIN